MIMPLKNVIVTNNVLEIRFYFAGKGTTRIPNRGVYGPLISAVSMVSGESLLWMFLSIFFGSIHTVLHFFCFIQSLIICKMGHVLGPGRSILGCNNNILFSDSYFADCWLCSA